MSLKIFFALLALTLSHASFTKETLREVKLSPQKEIKRLLKELDSDKDRKITVNDIKRGERLRFELSSTSGERFPVEGVYFNSNLLQELKLAEENKVESLSARRVFENPVQRISRSIKERYWDALTRRIDSENLHEVLGDTKVSNSKQFLYIPYEDEEAFLYFKNTEALRPELNLHVEKLPQNITPEYVKSLEGKHGLLVLDLEKHKGIYKGKPYVVPGGRFNEMYGWDSYFESLGLLADGRIDLARAMVDNFVYQINYYGKILNANRTYYLTRSQPPFLTSLIRAVYQELPKNKESKQWLANSLKAAIKEYHTVWMGKDRLTPTGLSRYFGNGKGIPPEVEPGHFDHVLRPYAKKHKLTLKSFVRKYEAGKVKEPELDEFFIHDRAVRESGHDTTYRWRVDGKDRAANFVTVDLNSLLYKYELDIASLIKKEFSGEFQGFKSQTFWDFAQARKKRIRSLLWNEKEAMFFDYNWKIKKQSCYVSATAFYPLWAHDPDFPETRILNEKEAKAFIDHGLNKLETAGGIAATARSSLQEWGNPKHQRQWEWPNGWAPHQMIIWKALEQYNYPLLAQRLIYKWLYMITKNARDYNGTIPEKYNVHEQSHKVFAEYGNVGTKFSYITREGFGWMNASYQVGLQQLRPELLCLLEKMTPPEWITGMNSAPPK